MVSNKMAEFFFQFIHRFSFYKCPSYPYFFILALTWKKMSSISIIISLTAQFASISIHGYTADTLFFWLHLYMFSFWLKIFVVMLTTFFFYLLLIQVEWRSHFTVRHIWLWLEWCNLTMTTVPVFRLSSLYFFRSTKTTDHEWQCSTQL